MLREYDEIMPGMVNRLVMMAEAQTNHRIDIESFAIRSEADRANRGQWFALIVVLAFIAGAVYLISQGHSAYGLVMGLAPTATIGGLFVYVNRSQRQEREARIELLAGQRPSSRR
jgi:uncharacterized membrane protein